MKKTFTLLVLSILSFSTLKAQIQNASFEEWTNMGSYETPTDWSTTNQYTTQFPGFGGSNVFKDGNAYDGDFCLKMETMNFILATIPGVVSLGDLDVDITTMDYNIGLAPYTYNSLPLSLTFATKSEVIEGDGVALGAAFTKWNGTTRDTVAVAIWESQNNIPEWEEKIAIVIPLIIGVVPDSMNVMMLSSTLLFDATEGNKFWVDDLKLYTLSGVEDLMPEPEMKTYFDNTSRKIIVKFSDENNSKTDLRCYDISGRLLANNQHNSGSGSLSYTVPPNFSGLLLVEAIRNGKRFTKKIIIR